MSNLRRVIGSCSICGGPVSVPNTWMGTQPPVPQCENCGARAARGFPTIEMAPQPRPRQGAGSFSVRRTTGHPPAPPSSEAQLSERKAKIDALDAQALRNAIEHRQCPLDGLALSYHDNPRHPGLNLEYVCICGFSFTD